MMRKPKKSQKKDNKLSSSNAVSVYHYDSISGYSLFILTSRSLVGFGPNSDDFWVKGIKYLTPRATTLGSSNMCSNTYQHILLGNVTDNSKNSKQEITQLKKLTKLCIKTSND